MNFPISVSSGLPSCTKTVTIKMSGQTIKLKQNHDVVVNGQDITKIPYVISGISVRAVSSIFLQGLLKKLIRKYILSVAIEIFS